MRHESYGTEGMDAPLDQFHLSLVEVIAHA
jgi:hypothetical protein